MGTRLALGGLSGERHYDWGTRLALGGLGGDQSWEGWVGTRAGRVDGERYEVNLERWVGDRTQIDLTNQRWGSRTFGKMTATRAESLQLSH